jgi:colanic acid biosynthesis protein WcaH
MQMDQTNARVPTETFETCLEHFPQVSVELVLQRDEGVLLAKRTNEPAKGEWFWPGGRLRKGERLQAAVDRVAAEELGLAVDIVDLLGVYEHFWEAPTPTQHTVNIAYLVEPVDATATVTLDAQHEAARYVTEPDPSLHEYVNAYLEDLAARQDS